MNKKTFINLDKIQIQNNHLIEQPEAHWSQFDGADRLLLSDAVRGTVALLVFNLRRGVLMQHAVQHWDYVHQLGVPERVDQIGVLLDPTLRERVGRDRGLFDHQIPRRGDQKLQAAFHNLNVLFVIKRASNIVKKHAQRVYEPEVHHQTYQIIRSCHYQIQIERFGVLRTNHLIFK